eukprot:98937-Prymnesium_polylepis.2
MTFSHSVDQSMCCVAHARREMGGFGGRGRAGRPEASAWDDCAALRPPRERMLKGAAAPDLESNPTSRRPRAQSHPRALGPRRRRVVPLRCRRTVAQPTPTPGPAAAHTAA